MVELRLGAYAYRIEYPGYPLLFFGRDRALALAAMIVIAFAREASHHAMAHGEKQLGGYFVEKACHTAGIVQLLAGAVTGTSGGPGQAADIKGFTARTDCGWGLHSRTTVVPLSPAGRKRLWGTFRYPQSSIRTHRARLAIISSY